MLPTPDAATPPDVRHRLSVDLRLLHVLAGRTQRQSGLHQRMLRSPACRRNDGGAPLLAPVRSGPVRRRRLRFTRTSMARASSGPTAAAAVTGTDSPRSRSAWRRARASPFRTACPPAGSRRRSASPCGPAGGCAQSQTVCALTCDADAGAPPLRPRCPSAPPASARTRSAAERDRRVDAPSTRPCWVFRAIAWRRRARHIKCAFAHIKSLNGRMK